MSLCRGSTSSLEVVDVGTPLAEWGWPASGPLPHPGTGDMKHIFLIGQFYPNNTSIVMINTIHCTEHCGVGF